jgi:hypothetical protein
MLLSQVPVLPAQVPVVPVRPSAGALAGRQLVSEFLMKAYGLAPDGHLVPGLPAIRSLVPWASSPRVGRLELVGPLAWLPLEA